MGLAITARPTREALAEFVKRSTSLTFHPAGTCRMGLPTDRESVVDSRCLVHGMNGLWVVDASVMPVLPRANTNLPTAMVAEKATAGIRHEAGICAPI